MLYIKGEVIMDGNDIAIVNDKGNILNPTKEQILADGWMVYEASVFSENEIIDHERENLISYIQEYDKSENVNNFLLNGENKWIPLDKRESVYHSTTIEKSIGIKNTFLCFMEDSMLVSCTDCLDFLRKIEVYAKQCYIVTWKHIQKAKSLKSVDEIKKYYNEVPKGYPTFLDYIYEPKTFKLYPKIKEGGNL